MKHIPKSFIQDLLNRVDIVTLIEQYVHLKKAGRDYQACCPFHHEKTPSFTVSPQKQFYHCFGCGEHGNAIGFLMAHDHLEFIDAVESLASHAGLTVPYEEKGSPKKTDNDLPSLYDCMEKAAKFYYKKLGDPSAKPAVDYLKQRGLSKEIVKQYQIGYAPDGWQILSEIFGSNPLIQRTLLEAGLLIENEQHKIYDRFRHRIMFPIRDKRGRVIAFGGRVLDDSTPKYLNSPETPIFHKGSELYGLYEAKQQLRTLHQLLVVEGYMDVIALAQHGIHYAVATLGTALTDQHVSQLFRLTPSIVFCFDGDAAGRKAATRSLEILLPVLQDDKQIQFMFLPEKDDPDSLVRKIGKEVFEKKVKEAVSFSDFFFLTLTQDLRIETIEGRAKLANRALPLIEKITAVFMKDLLFNQLLKLTRLGTEQIKQQMSPPSSKFTPKKINQRLKTSPIQTATALLIQYPYLATEAKDKLTLIEIPGAQLLQDLVSVITAFDSVNQVSTAILLEHWRHEPEFELLMQLASFDMMLEEKALIQEFQDTLTLIKQHSVQANIDRLMAKAAQFGLDTKEKEELHFLLKEKQKISLLNRGDDEHGPH